MIIRLEFLPGLVLAIVMASWFMFGILFFARKKPPAAPESRRERSSILGIALQGASYGIAWSVHRLFFSPIVALSKPLEIVLAVFTMSVAVGSVWFVSAAIRTLGKQWSLGARLIEGHKLITEGPYRLVRNPIYTGMFGMLLATGLAVSHWVGLLIAIVVYAVGTVVRVRSEEKLLRGAFGAEFDSYARRVPAVIPFLF
ncbi:MAG TPA: isoprenylcysteine carboxylmethyltransferase family protein [Pyrinomonadaceae bacterium]|nr:isoprenylcysteine carboxylmethyltransferase family protein [Pyrinomonadaceae bacterium]